MNNEPVAWIPKDLLKEMGKVGFRYTAVSFQEDEFYNIPLYTHPTKTLTDEEIQELWDLIMFKTAGDWEEDLHIKFAKAILRKANEK